MTTTPITPPPKLVTQWMQAFYGPQAMPGAAPGEMVLHIAAVAAQWGSDQELDACVKLLSDLGGNGEMIRRTRRPKPPSLKEQALMALEDGDIGPGASLTPVEVCTIRRALEQLDD